MRTHTLPRARERGPDHTKASRHAGPGWWRRDSRIRQYWAGRARLPSAPQAGGMRRLVLPRARRGWQRAPRRPEAVSFGIVLPDLRPDPFDGIGWSVQQFLVPGQDVAGRSPGQHFALIQQHGTTPPVDEGPGGGGNQP